MENTEKLTAFFEECLKDCVTQTGDFDTALKVVEETVMCTLDYFKRNAILDNEYMSRKSEIKNMFSTTASSSENSEVKNKNVNTRVKKGERINKRRRALGISQEDLGKLVGICQTVVSRIERGKGRKKYHRRLCNEMGNALNRLENGEKYSDILSESSDNKKPNGNRSFLNTYRKSSNTYRKRNFKERREAQGITQTCLASIVGVCSQTISKLEIDDLNGVRTNKSSCVDKVDEVLTGLEKGSSYVNVVSGN